MRNTFKWIAAALGGLLTVIAIAAVVLYLRGGARLDRHYDIQPVAVTVPTDSASLARGRHLAEAVTLCVACHGEDLSGKVLFEQPNVVRIVASNLTAGRGGIGGRYSDADFVRVIRHGVNRAGRGVMAMHSDAFQHLSRRDLGAIIAYVKSVPPVDHELPSTKGKPLGRVLLALGMFDGGPMPIIAAEVIDHSAPWQDTPAPGVTAAYGEYLVSIASCHMCHGPDLHGGPPIEEGAPPGPSLVAYGAPNGYSLEQFMTTLRTGVTSAGRKISPDHMPWKIYARMTDDELAAIREYIATLSGR